LFIDIDFFLFSLPKSFDFSNTSLDGHIGMGGESLTTSAFLLVEELEFDRDFVLGTLVVNFLVTLLLNELLLMSALMVSQLDL